MKYFYKVNVEEKRRIDEDLKNMKDVEDTVEKEKIFLKIHLINIRNRISYDIILRM